MTAWMRLKTAALHPVVLLDLVPGALRFAPRIVARAGAFLTTGHVHPF